MKEGEKMEILKKVQTIPLILFEHKNEIIVILALFCSIITVFNCIFKIKKHSKNINTKT
jgi:hypothetical protein